MKKNLLDVLEDLLETVVKMLDEGLVMVDIVDDAFVVEFMVEANSTEEGLRD